MRMLPVTKSAVPLTDVHHTNLLMLAQVKESRVGSVVSFKEMVLRLQVAIILLDMHIALLKFSRNPTLSKCALINGTKITHLFSQLLTFDPLNSSFNFKLCLFYKITNNLLYFPSDIFICKPLPSYASCHFHPLTFTIPFSNLSASQNSFVLSVLSLWNSLPNHIKSSSSLNTFKSKVNVLLY